MSQHPLRLIALTVALSALLVATASAQQRDRNERPPEPPTDLQPDGQADDQGRFQPPPEPRERGRQDRQPGAEGRARLRDPSVQLVPPRDRYPDRHRWKLGVYTRDTATGVEIRQVVPNSPAWQAGLESDDTIVTVDGYQVGFVSGQRYDLGQELQLRAGPDGYVTLLVQNRRNARLVNVEVELERSFLP